MKISHLDMLDKWISINNYFINLEMVTTIVINEDYTVIGFAFPDEDGTMSATFRGLEKEMLDDYLNTKFLVYKII